MSEIDNYTAQELSAPVISSPDAKASVELKLGQEGQIDARTAAAIGAITGLAIGGAFLIASIKKLGEGNVSDATIGIMAGVGFIAFGSGMAKVSMSM